MLVPPILVALTAATAVQRLHELRLSARNLRRLRRAAAARQAEVRQSEGRFAFGGMVLTQILLLTLPLGECAWWGAHAPTGWLILALAAWMLGQALRLASMRALGFLWNARGAVADGQPVVRSGPYRWLRHPNYLGVLLEGVALPLAGGAWRSLIALNLILVPLTLRRARAEEALLARDPAWRTAFAHLCGFVPRPPR